MGTKRVCPHTITLFNYTGEDENGNACYNPVLLEWVHVFKKEGINATNSADDAPHVHIFDDTVIASPPGNVTLDRSLYTLTPDSLQRALETPQGEVPYVPYNEWKTALHQEQYWTLSTEGKDYFAIGDQRRTDHKLPTDVPIFRITDVERHDVGTRRMWHWRIEAR